MCVYARVCVPCLCLCVGVLQVCKQVCVHPSRPCMYVLIPSHGPPPHHPELPHHLLAVPRNTRCRQIEAPPTRFSTLIAPRGLQSNLSDDVVKGSPPHPWAPRPTQTDGNTSPPGRPFPSLPPSPLALACFPPPPPVSSCQGRQETLEQHLPGPCALKGTPHGLHYMCVYTLYQTM